MTNTREDGLPEGDWGPCIEVGEIHDFGHGISHRDVCETSNGNQYDLLFEQQGAGGRFRIEILKQPDYGRRDASFSATSREQDGRRTYINISAVEMRTLDTAKYMAAQWVKQTDRYITIGRPLYDDEDALPSDLHWHT